MTLGFDQSVNRFRARRGEVLGRQIRYTAERLGRKIDVLDVGGRANYWRNVGIEGIARILLLNTSRCEFADSAAGEPPSELFEERIGDGRDLSEYPDQSVDLVHSNSVIEHVGGWSDMLAMATEVCRVGRSGWIQTPAREFPVEPHFHLPFVHWLHPSLRSRALRLSPLAAYRRCSDADRRWVVDGIHLLSGSDVRKLFPGRAIHTEWLVVPKSYVVRWTAPADAPASAPAA